MTKFKPILVAAIGAVMVLSLAACGDKNEQDTSAEDTSSTTVTATDEEGSSFSIVNDDESDAVTILPAEEDTEAAE